MALKVALTVSDALPVLEGTKVDAAEMVTTAGAGTLVGAVYKPDPEMVPTVLLPPAMPLTCHVTVLVSELSTVATKVVVWPMPTMAVRGAMLTTGGVIVTVALAVSAGFATDRAVMVTVVGDGIAAGAV